MSKLLLYIIFIFFITFSTSAAQDKIAHGGIITALNDGNAKKLAVYFNPNVELLVLNKRDVYNKMQAELIVRNFFSNNKPLNFELLYKSDIKNTFYVVGKLKTIEGVFTVYFLVKKSNSKYYIHQLKIEEEKS